MSFLNFNTTNNYLTPTNFTRKLLGEGLMAYMTQPQNLVAFLAFQRANLSGALNPINLFVTNIWAALPLATPIPGQIISLCNQVDAYWPGAIEAQGLLRLTAEAVLRRTYYATGPGAGTCPSLEDFAKQPITAQHRAKFFITKAHMIEYASLLKRIAAPFGPPASTLEYHKTYKQALELTQVADTFNGADDVEEGSTKHTNLVDCANFWQKEVAAIAARAPVSDWMENWVGVSARPDVLKRLVSEEEKTDLEDNDRLAQGPGSFERHKWFYFGTGAPGVGHAREMHLVLHGTPIAHMVANARDVSTESQKTSEHALLKKGNERDCIGIHEDLLAKFYANLVNTHKFVK